MASKCRTCETICNSKVLEIRRLLVEVIQAALHFVETGPIRYVGQ